MNKSLLISVVILLTFSFTVVPVFSQSAGDILAKWTEAQGGKEKLTGIETKVIKGTMNIIPQGTTINMVMSWKKGKTRHDIDFGMGSIIRVFDGEKGYVKGTQTQGKVVEVPQKARESLKRQSMGDDVVVNPKKYGVTFTYKGKEKVKETDCLVLEQTFSDGYKSTIYLDAQSSLPFMQKSMVPNNQGGQYMQEVYYSEYRKVDGIMTAHKISVMAGEQEIMVGNFAEIKYNTKLDDSIFMLKEDAPATPPKK